jgi:lysozyme
MIIDVSKWQNKISWPIVKLKHPEIEGVYIKASEGIGYTDPTMTFNAVEAKKAGFKIGFYHFSSLNNIDVENDARMEAKYFLNVTRNFSVDYPFVLDIEKNEKQFSKENVLLWIKTFFNELEQLGVQDYVLYSYTPFLNENLPANHGLGNIPLWIAAYTEKLKLPNGWNNYYLWQYSSKGMIDGIKANVDLNKKP